MSDRDSSSTDPVLKHFAIRSGEDVVFVPAQSWECGGNGLKFIRDKYVVAWFINWDYFYEQ
jgi:hypothetical protein